MTNNPEAARGLRRRISARGARPLATLLALGLAASAAPAVAEVPAGAPAAAAPDLTPYVRPDVAAYLKATNAAPLPTTATAATARPIRWLRNFMSVSFWW